MPSNLCKILLTKRKNFKNKKKLSYKCDRGTVVASGEE